jgi:NAD-dependent dihydropyrimidine dehydrogenase PreA subunit
MKRNIITIDQEKCTGCGLCIPNCPEGAIQIIDNKARLVSDLMCDGLGACLGHCPEGAITIEEREAEQYDERKVMANIVKQGAAIIKAHLTHLKNHGQTAYFDQAIQYLNENHITIPVEMETPLRAEVHSGCPGARTMSFGASAAIAEAPTAKQPSALTHWPIQMHLISPSAPHFAKSDFLLAADCTAFSLAAFHSDYLKGKTLGIACPKLDDGQDVYTKKIKALIDEARINTLTVAIMQVPCCGGLLHIAKQAAEQARRKVPIKCVTVGIKGEILKEEWV